MPIHVGMDNIFMYASATDGPCKHVLVRPPMHYVSMMASHAFMAPVEEISRLPPDRQVMHTLIITCPFRLKASLPSL